jgi:His/Glu/Gln/Arg/opine family amino acid ABC transporter permease subunit
MSEQRILFDAPGPRARRRHAVFTCLGVLLVAGLLYVALRKMADKGQLDGGLWKPFTTAEVWREYLIPGLINTFKAAALSILLAGTFGLVFGMGRLSPIAPVRWVSGVIVEFFRAVPVLIMMIFAFGFYAQNQVFSSEDNPLAAVVTGLTLYNGAVVAELVRSGVHSLPKGQAEAGLSIGERLGAVAIDYRNEDFLARVRELPEKGVDVVLDGLGGVTSVRSFRALRPGGRLVVFGHYSTLAHGHKSWRGWIEWYAATATVGLWGLVSPRRRVRAYRIQKLRNNRPQVIPLGIGPRALPVGGGPRDPDWFRADFLDLLELLRADKIHPVIAARLPLSEARRAHELLEASASTGRLVLVS